MKKLFYSMFVIIALAVPAKAELFVDAVFLKLSCYTPYQMPIPWFYYEEDVSLWGEYSVYGLDLGFPWSQSRDVYGFGTAIYLGYEMTAGASVAVASTTGALFGFQTGVYNYAEMAAGFQLGAVNMAETTYGFQASLFNYAETACGFQLGVVNMCDRAYGVQVGVINIIKDSPLPWFPVVNALF